MATFGDRAFKEIIKAKWVIWWFLIKYDLCPYKKMERHQGRLYREEACEDTQEDHHLQAS